MAKTNKEFIYEGMTPEEVSAFEADASGTPQAVDGTQPVVEQAAAEPQPVAGQEQITPPEQKMVDVRALQEARAAERSAREELARLRNESVQRSQTEAIERAKLEERISLINQAIEAQSKPQPKVPSKEEDVLAWYDHQIETVNGKFATLEQELKGYKDAETKRNEEASSAAANEARRTAMISEASHVIEIAAQANPDLQGALDHALNGIRAEIANMLEVQQVPWAQRQATADQIWRNSMANLAQRCPRDPGQAAEFVMQNARYYGYGYQQPQAAAPVQQPVAQPATPQQRAEQQQRHLSLSGTQGGQPPATLDAKSLANMTDDEFFALKKSVEGRKKITSIQAGN